MSNLGLARIKDRYVCNKLTILLSLSVKRRNPNFIKWKYSTDEFRSNEIRMIAVAILFIYYLVVGLLSEIALN